MEQSNTSADKADKKKNTKIEIKVSFALALITLSLIFGYFLQSFIQIHQHKTVVIAIERIEAMVDSKSEQK